MDDRFAMKREDGGWKTPVRQKQIGLTGTR